MSDVQVPPRVLLRFGGRGRKGPHPWMLRDPESVEASPAAIGWPASGSPDGPFPPSDAVEDMTSSPPDARLFRHVMGHFGSGVTVITASGDSAPVGFTASSVASLSLEPTLVMVAVGEEGESLPAIRAAGAFAVNILARDQEPMALRFASGSRETRFRDLELGLGVTGAPVLPGVLGWLDCRLHDEFVAGDHVVVVGRVEACDAREGEPLLYFRGRFGGWAS